jgi:hypothetical protein
MTSPFCFRTLLQIEPLPVQAAQRLPNISTRFILFSPSKFVLMLYPVVAKYFDFYPANG